MASVVFCDHCRREKGWRKPSLRVSRDPCDICGDWDAVRKRKVNPTTGRSRTVTVKLPNFEQDDKFLVGTSAEARLQEPL